jgi:hypothetical protein
VELPAYIDTVIRRMHATKTKDDTAERNKRVVEQEKALLRMKRVMEARLRSEFSAGDVLAFDTGIDDDEMLLRFMHAVDSGVDADGDGAISEQELLDWPQLTDEVKKALQYAFACNLEAVEEALAKVDAEDFGEYRRGAASGGTFDKKASAKAVFSAVANTAGDSGWVGKASLELLATKLKGEKLEKLASALTDLASQILAADAQLDFIEVKRGMRRVPRVTGPRMDWARGLGLDAALARQLPPGTLEDGLAGVRGMPSEEARRAVDAFLEDARVRIYTALVEAKKAQGSKSAAEANSKFEGFQGSFATLEEFHLGAEASLNLGYPNPDTMKGILNEHTQHPSAERFFCTSNYRIVTCLLIEYAWAVMEQSLEDLEAIWTGDSFPLVKMQMERAHKLVRKLVTERDGADAMAPDNQLLFPGEVGDRFSESLMMLAFPSVAADSPEAKMLGGQAKAEASKLLKTDEERAREVLILDHKACMERIGKETLAGKQRATGALLPGPGGQVAADNGLLRVGVLLPMSLVRAEAIRGELLAGVKVATGRESVVDKVAGYTWTFSRFTSVKELRKWLKEKSLADLRKVLEADGKKKEWAHVDPADGRWAHDNDSAYELLCEAMVSSFVLTDLQEDLREALMSGASDAHVEALLAGWGLTPKSVREERIEQAAAALDSEEKWRKVEDWVRLHRGRIQGRTRLGLRALMASRKDKIEQFGLTVSEVLGAHIYTGANFVPLNGICRSFPPSILELLKGDNTTPDNKMCTTLFCISSCLKKLSQKTELPESRCSPSLRAGV